MTDVGVEVLHQLPALQRRQGLGPLQQLPLQQPGRIPHLRIGKAGELQICTGHEGHQTLQVVTGFLGVQVHVREVGIRGAIQGPALLMVAPQPVVLRQLRQQLAAQLQTRRSGAHGEGREGALGAVDLPATPIGIQKQVQERPGLQQGRQGPQTRLRLPQVVQDPHGIDVVEGALPLQLQQAAVLDPHLGLLMAAGTAQPLAGHLQGAGRDIHRQDLGPRIEMGQVVGADPGAATGIQDPQGLPGGPRRRQRAGAGGSGRIHAPAPVVSRRRAVLEGITGVGKAVVEGAHHRGGGIGGGLGHGRRTGTGGAAGQRLTGSISCSPPGRLR